MNDQFDELASNMAQSVTRRGALKKFGVGLAGMALATLGLANKAHADGLPPGSQCKANRECASGVCKRYRVPCLPDGKICTIRVCQ